MRTVDEWSEIAEAAFEDFKESRRKFANAKADYEHKRLSVKAQSDAKSQTARDSEAEVAARDEKVALIRAESSLDIAESYLKLAQNEMVAAMSIRKYAGTQDGGGDGLVICRRCGGTGYIEPLADRTHGLPGTYTSGCRCEDCTEAWRIYSWERRERAREEAS